ncbi:hypothetical protein [Salisediminibacterium selenitireducens]|uniref:Uncharacterized protein n=1 Tax=Bacillus selenitireducens (strain ATCC 700615 / DSM 15326 / MLS10) TaxID=439292 RepID=D6XZH7_BACIE|nr:hypothetical protein [Salisediminibacterium selenitireducens]ADH98351.1 hypothetical protein Bsel_0823 [[Bacillus] selenitireducens MLS10]
MSDLVLTYHNILTRSNNNTFGNISNINEGDRILLKNISNSPISFEVLAEQVQANKSDHEPYQQIRLQVNQSYSINNTSSRNITLHYKSNTNRYQYTLYSDTGELKTANNSTWGNISNIQPEDNMLIMNISNQPIVFEVLANHTEVSESDKKPYDSIRIEDGKSYSITNTSSRRLTLYYKSNTNRYQYAHFNDINQLAASNNSTWGNISNIDSSDYVTIKNISGKPIIFEAIVDHTRVQEIDEGPYETIEISSSESVRISNISTRALGLHYKSGTNRFQYV